jgi:riboflavin biosynthesis pyrimidine reductase
MKKIINENKQQKEEKIIKDLNNENEILKNFSSKENIDSAIIEGGESLIKEYLLYNNK